MRDTRQRAPALKVGVHRRRSWAERLRIACLAVVALVGTCHLATAGQAAAGRSAEAVALERRVDALFGSHIRPDGPGCAVGIYQGGEVVLTRGFGLANVEDGRAITPRTAFGLGSVSKPFTALAVLMLERQNKVSLDDDVRRWVPELPDYGTPMRVRDLVQHTSGLRDYAALETLSGKSITTMPEFLALLAAQRALNFPPGTRHEYSHSDYLLLGLVVERAAGVPFGEHLEREVLGPMQMKGSFVHDTRPRTRKDRAFGHRRSAGGDRVQFPGDVTVGGSNVYASVEDLAHWDRNFDRPAVGGPEVIARMLSRPVLANGDTVPYAYGLQLGMYRGLRTVSRGSNDQGTRTEMIRFPDQRFTVATLCNTETLEPRKLAQGVADLFLGDAMSPPRALPQAPTPVTVPPRELARYAGVYRPLDAPWNLLPIEVRDGVLGEVDFDAADDEAFYAMKPAGDGRFFEIGSTGNVGLFSFRPAGRDGTLRLEITWTGALGDASETLERVADSALWRPSATALAEYAGSWHSAELDVGWQLEARGEKLILRRRGQRDLTLRPVERDYFLRGFGQSLSGQLQFHRDSAGTLTHLTVSTPPGEESARGVSFVRIAPR